MVEAIEIEIRSKHFTDKNFTHRFADLTDNSIHIQAFPLSISYDLFRSTLLYFGLR